MIWNTWNFIVPYLCDVLLRLKVVYEVLIVLKMAGLFVTVKNQNIESPVLVRNLILKNDV